MDVLVSTAPMLLSLITIGGAALLGVGLAIGLALTRRRREDPVARWHTDAGTRERAIPRGRSAPGRPRRPTYLTGGEGPRLTVTQARQGVRGHKVSMVLAVSLFLAAISGGIFLAWLLMFPTSFGRHVPPPATANSGNSERHSLGQCSHAIERLRDRFERYAHRCGSRCRWRTTSVGHRIPPSPSHTSSGSLQFIPMQTLRAPQPATAAEHQVCFGLSAPIASTQA